MHVNDSKRVRVGIFWVVEGEVVHQSLSLEVADEHDGMHDSPDEHHAFWERWKRSRGAGLREASYDQYPRGRVIYDARRQIIWIYADRCLLPRSELIAEICRLFELNGDGIRLQPDFHYQCRQCNPNFISD